MTTRSCESTNSSIKKWKSGVSVFHFLSKGLIYHSLNNAGFNKAHFRRSSRDRCGRRFLNASYVGFKRRSFGSCDGLSSRTRSLVIDISITSQNLIRLSQRFRRQLQRFCNTHVFGGPVRRDSDIRLNAFCRLSTEEVRSFQQRIECHRQLPQRSLIFFGLRTHSLNESRNHNRPERVRDRKSTRLNSSHVKISYAVFCLKKKKKKN